MHQDQPLRVLHIDDDSNATRLVAAMLGARGIAVTELHDPTRAIECILSGNFRIVILDIDMPGIDGIDLLQQIKQADGGTAVIMLTAVISLTNVLRSMRKGATACLFKPLTDANALVDCIHEVTNNLSRWWETLRQLSEIRRNEQATLADEFLSTYLRSAEQHS